MLQAYDESVAKGVLQRDPQQVSVLAKFAELEQKLVPAGNEAASSGPSNWFAGWISTTRFGSRLLPRPKPPMGIYLYGDVGNSQTCLLLICQDAHGFSSPSCFTLL